jgi:shikimate kinase
MNGLIILIGFRGTGKTTVGELLAQRCGCSFVDTDQRICQIKGASVTTIVQREGWEGFRRCEEEVLRDLADATGGVVATGGGAVLHRQVWPELKKNATIVWLTADTSILMQRIGRDAPDNRPSLSGKGIVEEMIQVLEEREPLYRQLADFSVDTGRLPAVEAVDYIVARVAKIQQ